MKKRSESFQQESLIQTKSKDICLSETAKKELHLLKKRKIDLSDPDAPEIVDWSKVVIGKFYRPIKKQITLRMDADILEWFKDHADKYQPLINQACREYIANHTS
jgi:uncharacterized protein (DUF4415 family)